MSKLKHSKALTKIKKKGAPASFVFEGPSDFDPLTDSFTDTTATTVSGYAAEIPARPEEYEALSLVPLGLVTLFFVPETFGEQPELGSVILWAGQDRTVMAVTPIRPTGTSIASRVVVE